MSVLKGCGMGCLGMVVFVLVLMLFWPDSDLPEGPNVPEPPRFGTPVTMCQERVRSQLRSPSTADFPWGYSDYVNETATSGTYVYAAWVDAENAFGAEVRTDFRCVFRQSHGRWTVAELEVTPR